MIACTFSLGNWILPFWHPSLDRQSTNWLVEPFYITLGSHMGNYRSEVSADMALFLLIAWLELFLVVLVSFQSEVTSI